MSNVTVAALQCAYSTDMAENIARVGEMISEAAKKGAQIILPSELLQGHYFCREEAEHHFDSAYAVADHPVVKVCTVLAKKIRRGHSRIDLRARRPALL